MAPLLTKTLYTVTSMASFANGVHLSLDSSRSRLSLASGLESSLDEFGQIQNHLYNNSPGNEAAPGNTGNTKNLLDALDAAKKSDYKLASDSPVISTHVADAQERLIRKRDVYKGLLSAERQAKAEVEIANTNRESDMRINNALGKRNSNQHGPGPVPQNNAHPVSTRSVPGYTTGPPMPSAPIGNGPKFDYPALKVNQQQQQSVSPPVLPVKHVQDLKVVSGKVSSSMPARSHELEDEWEKDLLSDISDTTAADVASQASHQGLPVLKTMDAKTVSDPNVKVTIPSKGSPESTSSSVASSISSAITSIFNGGSNSTKVENMSAAKKIQQSVNDEYIKEMEASGVVRAKPDLINSKQSISTNTVQSKISDSPESSSSSITPQVHSDEKFQKDYPIDDSKPVPTGPQFADEDMPEAAKKEQADAAKAAATGEAGSGGVPTTTTTTTPGAGSGSDSDSSGEGKDSDSSTNTTTTTIAGTPESDDGTSEKEDATTTTTTTTTKIVTTTTTTTTGVFDLPKEATRQDTARMDEHKLHLEEMAKMLAAARLNVTSLEEQIRKQKIVVEKAQATVDDHRDKISSGEARLNDLGTTKEAEAQAVGSAEAEVESLKQQLEEAEWKMFVAKKKYNGTIADWETQRADIKTEKGVLADLLKSAAKEETHYQHLLELLEKAQQDLEKAIAKYEAALNKLHDLKSEIMDKSGALNGNKNMNIIASLVTLMITMGSGILLMV